jgi:hypothetical protein
VKGQKGRILEILGDGQPHSHHEFYGFCVLHSRISELRRRYGYDIRCWRDGDDYLYQLGGVRESDLVPATGGADRDRPTRGQPSTAVPPASTTPETAEADVAGLGHSPPSIGPGQQLTLEEVAA